MLAWLGGEGPLGLKPWVGACDKCLTTLHPLCGAWNATLSGVRQYCDGTLGLCMQDMTPGCRIWIDKEQCCVSPPPPHPNFPVSKALPER